MSNTQTMPAFIEQISDNIRLGMLDHVLPHLINIINDRQKRLAPKVAGISIRDARVGQKVVFNERVRPTYLRGQTAVITKVNRERVKLKLDNPLGRFGSKPVNTPVSIINFVS